MTEPQIEVLAAVPAQCVLGEGPVWDHRLGCLWFTDIQSAQLLRLDWPSTELTRFALPERLGSIGLTVDPAELVCAFASGFARYSPVTGACEWLHRTEPQYRGIRMNDGRVDRQGRFWAGSMVEHRELASPEKGALYRLDSAAAPPVRVKSGIAISNAICFSPNGDCLYFTDTLTQQILRYPLDPDTGALGIPTRFATLSGKGFPDGADTDAAGRVWNAEWGGGKVTAYNCDGSLYAQLPLPVSQVTCVTFGGSEDDLLFVTSARQGLSLSQLNREPQAGDLFVFRAGVRGLPTPVWRG